MKNSAQLQKGIITIAIALLASALLMLAAGIAYQSSMKKATSSELGKIESARQSYNSAASVVASLARKEAADITISGNNLSMRTNITRLANYPRDLTRLQNFIYAKSDANLTLDLSEAINPTLHIRPQDIAASFSAGKLTITPQNSPQSAGNITGYTIALTFNQPTPAFNWSVLAQGSQSNSSSIAVLVIATGTNGTVSNLTYIDKYAPGELRLLDSSNHSIATLQFSSPAILTVNYDAAYASFLEANLTLGQTPYVELGTTLINITGDVKSVGPVVFK